MLTCKQITELVTDYGEGHLCLQDRLRFQLHLVMCRHCRAYVRQLETTTQALGKLPEPEVPPQLMDDLLRRFDGWEVSRHATEQHPTVPKAAFLAPASRREPRPRAFAAVLAVFAVLALIVAVASHRSRSPADWVVASALAASAFALAAVASRFSLGGVAAGVSAALMAALLAGGGGSLDLSTGLHCLAIEVASAAAVAGAAWLPIRRGLASSQARHALPAAAVAGALAGDAALQITCGAHSVLLHLVVFHVGGVLVAAAGALLALRAWPRPTHP
jgi:hypothetical protein